MPRRKSPLKRAKIADLPEGYFNTILGSKTRKFTAEDERKWALKILAVISDLSQRERKRVLTRANKINEP